jgi:hypothetical protein
MDIVVKMSWLFVTSICGSHLWWQDGLGQLMTHIWSDTLLNKYKEKFPHPPTGTHIYGFLDLFYEKWNLITLRFFGS